MAKNQRLSAVITLGAAVSPTIKNAFGAVNRGITGVGKSVTALEKQQRLLGRSIREFGRAGKNVDGMRERYASLTAEIERTRKATQRLEAAQKRARAFVGVVGKVGMAVGAGAGAVALAGRPLVGAAMRQQNEETRTRSLGFSQADADLLLKAARDQKAFGVSITQSTENARDLAAAFGDVRHAITALQTMNKMQFGAKLFGEKGEEYAGQAMNMARVIELRGGMKSEDEFRKQANMAFQVMTASGGRITPEGQKEFIGRAGIAGKGMSDEAFFYSMAPVMNEMGPAQAGTALASQYQALAQGHITKRAAQNLEAFGLIGDKSKVTNDKSGQLSFLNPGALKDYSTFISDPMKWWATTGVDAMRRAKLNPDSAKDVAQFTGQIVSNRNGANMGATAILQRNQIAKDARVASQSDNIDQAAQRRMNTAEGRQEQAEARLADAKMRMGNSILPMYASAMDKAATALERFNNFADENPRKLKAITGALLGGAGLVAGLTVIGAVGPAAATGLRLAATAVAFLGRTLLLNPIGLAVTGIAVAAYEIIEHWKPIKTFFSDLWDSVLSKFETVSKSITTKAQAIGGAAHTILEDIGLAGAGENVQAHPSVSKAPPAVPPPASRASAPASTTTVHVGGITVNALPGQSTKDIARDVIAELNKKTAVQSRSVMFDGPGQ